MDSNSKTIINNEYDYSNCVPTIESVSYLVKYCDQVYKSFIKLVLDDEENNKKLKQEYRQYKYKRKYSERFKVYIVEKTYNNITCNDYDAFIETIKDGNLNDVRSLEIKMDLDFIRGREKNFGDYTNSFTVLFKPYEIIFARMSNYKDANMNEIENQINNILKQFPIANSIFCNKEN